MSWQNYVDQITDSVTCELVVIAGQDGTIWAEYHTQNMVSTEEIKVIVDNLKGNVSELEENGIQVAGLNYLFVKGETGKDVYGKKGNSFLNATLTTQAIIIAVSGEREQPETFNQHVLKAVETLVKAGM